MKFLLFVVVVVAAVAAFFYLNPQYRDSLPFRQPVPVSRPSLTARIEPLVMQMSKATEFSKVASDAPSKADILVLQQELKMELSAANAPRRAALLPALRTCDVMLEMWREYEAMIVSALDSRSKPSNNRAYFNRAIVQRWYAYNTAANVRLHTAFAELKAAETGASVKEISRP